MSQDSSTLHQYSIALWSYIRSGLVSSVMLDLSPFRSLANCCAHSGVLFGLLCNHRSCILTLTVLLGTPYSLSLFIGPKARNRNNANGFLVARSLEAVRFLTKLSHLKFSILLSHVLASSTFSILSPTTISTSVQTPLANWYSLPHWNLLLATGSSSRVRIFLLLLVSFCLWNSLSAVTTFPN